MVAVLSGWAYDLRVKATAASVLPYALSFGLLPAFVVLALPGAPFPPGWVLLAGGLIGAGAHFVNAVPDLADDEQAGVRGLPHRLGARRSTTAAVVLLVAATAVLALGPPGRPGPVALLAFGIVVAGLAAGVLLGRRPGSRARFRAVLVVALVDVLLLLLQGRTLV